MAAAQRPGRVPLAIVVLAVVSWALSTPGTTPLEIGTFFVLSVTLIVLIFYTYSTHTLAAIERDRWRRESVLGTTYIMEMPDPKFDNSLGRTLFKISNPSTLVVYAKIWCNFSVNGTPVEYHDDFNGRRSWCVFPGQVSQGWFEIAPLAEKAGTSMPKLKAERTPANSDSQLTMNMRIEFRDELGNKRQLPPRKEFFDFLEGRWIPILTMSDEDWPDSGFSA